MLILAIDTTSEFGGAAIYRGPECLAEVANEGPGHGYSITLFEMTERLIQEVRGRTNAPLKKMADIELYAVANGPGSFTGIRVGLAATQGWATAFNRAAKGVSVLEALVETARPESKLAIPILDAHRGEFYLGAFQRTDDGRFVPVAEGLVLKPEAVKSFAREQVQAGKEVSCVVRAGDRAVLELRARLPDQLQWQSVEGTILQAIARIGHRAALEGKLDRPSQLDACYIRRSDAELSWKE